MRDKIIEVVVVIIFLGLFLFPFWIFFSLFHIDIQCFSYGKIKNLLFVDRGFYIYELESGTRWRTQYTSYQNGETVCLQERRKILIRWETFKLGTK